MRRAGDPVDLRWVKRRWKCQNGKCPRGTFTGSLPQVPPRCRVTGRLREQAGAEVAERGITPAEAARHEGITWPVAHSAFAARVSPVLVERPAPVARLGINEHRRGRPRWCKEPDTGEYAQLADRWHACFYDLSGSQGMLGQVEGRTADDAAYWLAGAAPAWRDAVQVVAIDMCTIFASAVRRMLPRAKLAVDLSHVVQLAVKTVGDVRRRAIRELYGPEYGIKHLLERNAETLSPDDFAKIIETSTPARKASRSMTPVGMVTSPPAWPAVTPAGWAGRKQTAPPSAWSVRPVRRSAWSSGHGLRVGASVCLSRSPC